ncbi:MAG: creatininase family protein [Deltaproteobacteria bacterium]|nr:creatininase family protein [Deltaproteobacteria bacterium]
MDAAEVILPRLTRRECREALQAGKFQTAILATASNEQHSEHLPMDFDLIAVTHIAREAAATLYPQVIVTVPMAIGISEHHMIHKGTISAKPGGWLSVIYDAVESLARHGIRNILILNGHGGNTVPIKASLDQWRLHFKLMDPGLNLHFVSYWDLIPIEFFHKHMKTRAIPGHAKEFETSIALALFPDKVRREAMREHTDPDPLEATAEKGSLFLQEAICRVAEFLGGIISGKIQPAEVKHFP